VQAFLADRSDVTPLKERREHPLTHISNPQAVKLRIEETEEKLRTGLIQPHERRKIVLDLAEDCAEIRQYEKALSRLSELLRQRNEPDCHIINRMAIYCGNMGSAAREEKLYGEASAADPTASTPWFNLALLMKRQKRFDEARHAIDMSIGLEEDSAPLYVLQAQIARDQSKDGATKESLDSAWQHFPEPGEQNDWELGWYITAAEMRDDKASAAAAREERSRRKVRFAPVANESRGMLPSLAA
jgi:tetratricopeptide (TPR) repeat protein